MDPPKLRVSPLQVVFPAGPYEPPPAPPPTATITIGTTPGGAAPAAPVAFKIKTTCPTRYVVRPNAGVLSPEDEATVEISLTPAAEGGLTPGMPAVPPPAVLCRDRFQVQAVAMLPDVTVEDAFWEGAATSRTNLNVAVEGYSVEAAAPAGGGGGGVPVLTPSSPGRRPPSRPPSYASASSGVRDGVVSSPPPAPSQSGGTAGLVGPTSVAAHVAQLQAGAIAAGAPLPPSGRAGRVGAAITAPAPGTDAGMTTPAPALTEVANKDGLPPAGVAGARPGDAALATEYGALLAPGRHDEAVERARELSRALDASRAEAARVRTAVEETVAAAETILEDAPKAPLATHVLASDAYGGVSVAGVGLMVAAAAVLTKLVW